MKKMIFDAIDKTTTVVEINEIIITDYELQVAALEQEAIAKAETKSAEKAAAKQVLLDRLGITADEAKLLLS
jgi:hypothetical protein